MLKAGIGTLLLLCTSLLTIGCRENEAGRIVVGTDGEIVYEGVRGAIRVDGSSTSIPITEAVVEEFSKEA